jgi:hypothetical protein
MQTILSFYISFRYLAEYYLLKTYKPSKVYIVLIKALTLKLSLYLTSLNTLTNRRYYTQ